MGDRLVSYEVWTYKGGLEVAHCVFEDSNGFLFRKSFPGRVRSDGRGL